MNTRLGALVTLMLVGLTTGCSSHSFLRSLQPAAEPDNTRGLRYYAPRDAIRLEANVTFNRARGWAKGTTEATLCRPDTAGPFAKVITTEITSATVPDRRVAYHLVMVPSSSAAQNLKLALTNDGLLTSLNYTVEDKRAEIAGNILKSVAGIAGTVIGIDQLIPGGFMSAERRAERLARDRGEKCAQRVASELMDRLFLERDTLERQLMGAQREREKNLARIPDSKDEAAMKALAMRDELHARRIAVLDARLATVRDAIAARVASFKADSGITARDTVIRVSAVFDLVAIPRSSVVEGRLGSLQAVHEALKAHPEAQRLADSARLVITLDDLASPGSVTPVSTSQSWTRKDCPVAAATDDCVHIYSRAPRPWVVSLYTAIGPQSSFALTERRIVSLISSADPIVDVPISTKTLGQQSFALTFGRSGTLTGYEQTSTAGLATATSAIASALTGARQEFTAALSTVQTAQASLNAISAGARAERIKELQDEKSLLEARIALQGTTANKDLVAQKQQLDAQIALLNAEQSLATAQQKAATDSDLAAMKAEIARLQTQLELLKAQMELEKLKKTSQPQ